MTNSGATNPTGGGPINWQPAATSGSDSNARTQRSATFVADGKEYTVTVSYSRQAVMDKYEIDDSGVDVTMEQVISKIGAEQLKNLAGHSISTSLQDVDKQIQYKANTDSKYQAFSEELKDSHPKLFETISSVRDVFRSNSKALSEISTRSGNKPIDVTVSVNDELRTGESEPKSAEPYKIPRKKNEPDNVLSSQTDSTVRFSEVKDTGSTKFISQTEKFADKLYGKNPIGKDPEKLNKIILANAKINPDVKADDTGYEEQKKEVIEALKGPGLNLTQDQQNDVLKHLDNVEFADDIRVALELQKKGDVFLDVSQTTLPISGQPEGVGKSACASICGEAILYMSENDSFIADRNSLSEVLEKGIQRHVGSDPVVDVPEGKGFDHVFEEIKSRYENDSRTMELSDFTHESYIEHTVKGMKKDDYMVFTAQVKKGGSEKETLLLFKKDEPEQWAVLDSHGTQENGADRGASVRWFNDADEAIIYLSKHLDIESTEKEIFKVSAVDKAV